MSQLRRTPEGTYYTSVGTIIDRFQVVSIWDEAGRPVKTLVMNNVEGHTKALDPSDCHQPVLSSVSMEGALYEPSI